MDPKSIGLSLLIAVSAVIYGLYVGRAKGNNLRASADTLRNGKLRDKILLILIICVMGAVLIALSNKERESISVDKERQSQSLPMG